MYDFSKVDPVKACAWLVLPTVYDESLSYGEQLNKFCKALNDLIENNNNIPDYVASMIQQYITSGAIDEVVRNILASYILNVKYPPKGITPAVGDGSADDTEAIQGCIDYAYNQGGGCVYFPFGKYLTKSITLKSGVSLIGFDRYSTKIVQRGGDTKPLLSGGNVQNVQVSNLTLDGNNEVQTDDLDVINVLGKDVLLTNLVVKSGYQCLVYSGLGGDLQVDNVVFGGAVKKVAVISGSDSVQMSNVKFNELGKIQGECVLDVSSNSGVFKFSSKAVAPLCVKCSGSRNTFEFDCENSSKNFEDNGQFNNFNVLGVEIKGQLAQNKSVVVNGSGYNTIIGNSSEIVNENKLSDFSGNYTENIGKNKITTVKGNATDNITGNHEVDIDGYESKHVDGISSVNIGGARTEVYGGARNVGVAGANIEEYHDSMTETFDGKHIVKGSDEINAFSGNVNNTANKFVFNSTEKSLPINFPDKTVDLYKLENKQSLSNMIYPSNAGTLTVTNDTRLYGQGFTMSKTDFYYLMRKTDESMQRIYSVNRQTGNSFYKDFTTLGHGNSMTFYNNMLYVSTWKLDNTQSQIAVINPSNLTIEKYIDTATPIVGLCVDPITNITYARGSDFNFYTINLSTGALNKIFNKPDFNFNFTGQGLGAFNNKLYMPVTNPTAFIIINLNGEVEESYNIYPWAGVMRLNEIEDCEADSNGYMFFNSQWAVPGGNNTFYMPMQFAKFNVKNPSAIEFDFEVYANHATLTVDNSTFNFIRGENGVPFYDIFEATWGADALKSYGCSEVTINVTKTDKTYVCNEIRSDNIGLLKGNNAIVNTISFYACHGTYQNLTAIERITDNASIVISGFTGYLNQIRCSDTSSKYLYNVNNSIVALIGVLEISGVTTVRCDSSIVYCYDSFTFELGSSGVVNIGNGIKAGTVNITTTETKALLTNLTMNSGYNRFSKYIISVNNVGYILYGSGSITIGNNTITARITSDGIYLKATSNITADIYLY